MAIALIIILLCVMLGVMVYVIGSLVKYIVLLGVSHQNEIEEIKNVHGGLIKTLTALHKSEIGTLRNSLTNDFLMKAELMEMHKDPKIAIPLTKVDLVHIPVQNDYLMGYTDFHRPDFTSFQMKTMKLEEIEGQYELNPMVLRNPKVREQVKDAISKEVAKYLIKHDLIESAIDERNMMIRFRINVLK